MSKFIRGFDESISADDIREIVAAASGDKTEDVKILRMGYTKRRT